MDILAQYGTSIEAEEKGRWFQNGDVEFLIARNGNRTYSDIMAVQFQAHNHTLSQRDTKEQREAANDRAEKIQIDAMSKSILLGWRGVERVLNEETGEKVVGQLKFGGEVLEYNQRNAAKLLAVKDFREWTFGKANDFKNFLLEVKAADEKNSANT